MVRRAHEWTQSAEWPTVHTVRGDGTTLPVPTECVDAAYAAMSLSAVLDPVTAVREVHGCFGQAAVSTRQPSRRPHSRRLTNWVTDVDIPTILESELETVSLDTYTGGAIFIAVAQKASRD